MLVRKPEKTTFVISAEQTTERSWRPAAFLKTRLSRFLPMYYVANIIGYFAR